MASEYTGNQRLTSQMSRQKRYSITDSRTQIFWNKSIIRLLDSNPKSAWRPYLRESE